METAVLPSGVTLKAYGDDLVMFGPGMTAERYQEVLGLFPADLSVRFIGWRATAKAA